MKKSSLFNIFLSLLIIILAALVCRMDFTQIKNPRCLVLLSILLAVNFTKELKKAWRNESSSWNILLLSDKLIFTIDVVILLVFLLLPIANNLPVGLFILSALFGLFITWWIADKLGSSTLKSFLYWN